MNNSSFNLQQPWEEVKEILKEINLSLTDEDLDYQPGREDELLQRLEKKLGKSKAEVKAIIESASTNEGKAS
jgi:GTP cyclohydrolase I